MSSGARQASAGGDASIFSSAEGLTKLARSRAASSYAGSAHVFVATRRIYMPGRTFDEANGWRGWIQGGVQVVPIDCQHAELLEEPARTEVAAKIRNLLARLHASA